MATKKTSSETKSKTTKSAATKKPQAKSSSKTKTTTKKTTTKTKTKTETKNASVSGNYSADDMRELSGLEPIRQSPGQYIGEVFATSATRGRHAEAVDDEQLTAGGFHLFVETAGNASDEATNSGADGKTYADRIDVILHKDQSITVQDNGRGIPPDINKTTGKTGIEMAYLTMNAGGKFKDKTEKKAGNYKTAQGLHGVGAACVAALSDRLDVTVYRDGKEYHLSAKCGVPGEFASDEIRAKFTPFDGKGSAVTSQKDTRSAKEKKGWETGTRVHWHPDPLIWGGTDIPIKDIYDYIEAQSYMAPAATYRIIDETGMEFEGHLGKNPQKDSKEPRITEFNKPGGIDDMINEKTAKSTNISPVISFEVPTSYVKKVTVENEDGTMGKKDIEYDCDVKVSLRWTSDSGSDIEGYANGVHCTGKHIDGFQRGMSRGMRDWINKSGVLTKKDEKDGITPTQDDITDGMVACVEVLLEDQCDFLGQTKEKLLNTEVLSCVSDAVKEQVSLWMNTKKNAAAAKRIAKSVVENARLRNKQKKERENAKKIKEKMGGFASKPSRLYDCREYGPGTEILLAEGLSAASRLSTTRNSRVQAILPFRGVPKGTYGLKDTKILENAEFADLVLAMNAKGIKENFDYENRRFDRIGIYTDADEDGNYIRSLLLVFIYTCFPGMIENEKVFIGCPPLYSITFKSGPQKNETIDILDETGRTKFLDDYMKKGGDLKNLKIERAKGLGEYSAETFRKNLSPEYRKVRIVTIEDVEAAEASLKLLFAHDKQTIVERRAWIDNTFEMTEEN